MTEKKRKTLSLNRGGAATAKVPIDVSFKRYRGTVYKKYFILRRNTEGVTKRVGKMLAPNDRLALAKAKFNFREDIKKGCEIKIERRV